MTCGKSLRVKDECRVRKKSAPTTHVHIDLSGILDPPADKAGDPLEKRGLTDCPVVCYPPFLKGDVTDR